MMDLPVRQTVSPLGQLAPDMPSNNVPNINMGLIDYLRKFAQAAMMANGQNPAAAPQQPQPQPIPQNQNPGMGSLNFPNMNPQNTGLTPQFGAQIGGALKKGLFGG